MIYLEQQSISFESLRRDLLTICPWVEINKVAPKEEWIDKGFSADNAYIIELNLEKSEYDLMMDDLIQLEIDAFNYPVDGKPDEVLYERFMRYGWLWNLFHNAKKIILD